MSEIYDYDDGIVEYVEDESHVLRSGSGLTRLGAAPRSGCPFQTCECLGQPWRHRAGRATSSHAAPEPTSVLLRRAGGHGMTPPPRTLSEGCRLEENGSEV